MRDRLLGEDVHCLGFPELGDICRGVSITPPSPTREENLKRICARADSYYAYVVVPRYWGHTLAPLPEAAIESSELKLFGLAKLCHS